jgi:DNA helicase-2/ATP-dependent DNA helicase PcrA
MTQLDLFSAPAADPNSLLDGLNPQQRAAVVHRGPALLIVAGQQRGLAEPNPGDHLHQQSGR